MLLVSCEVNLMSAWSANCVISSATGETKFAVADTKLYVSIVFIIKLYQLKIMQNCSNKQNLALKEQLAGINFN